MSFLASQKYHTHMYRPQEETVSKLSKMWPTEIRQLPESRWSLVDFTTISIQSPRSDTSSIEFTAINFGTTSLHIAFYTWRAGVRAGLCVSFFIVLLLASRSDISSSHRWLRQPPSIILFSSIDHALEGDASPATVPAWKCQCGRPVPYGRQACTKVARRNRPPTLLGIESTSVNRTDWTDRTKTAPVV